MAELSAQPTSIQSLYSMFSDDKLFVNRRYQRKLVWTLLEKQKLIESILKKYPVPAILFAEVEGAPGTFEIIDGLQRLHAIISFIETSFPTLDGKLFDLEYFPTAKGRSEAGVFELNTADNYISQREVSTILDYIMALSIMRNATENEINDVFDRINTYGHRLSDQERRQAGVQNDFSNAVRTIACTLRGDDSLNIVPLKSMPSISIDLPMSKHGYEVKADEVFWVMQGVLRSTDLRDSMDEQCIADIAACIVSGSLIERSKDALDSIYMSGSPECEQMLSAIEVYGAEKFAEEFKFCVDEILQVCTTGKPEKLRDILFKNKSTNPFPSIFAILTIAFYELIIVGRKKISDYAGVKGAFLNLDGRLEKGRSATSSAERRKNIDIVKAVISPFFIAAVPALKIYGNHATVDIESVIRRSEVELADYELKQGLLALSDKRDIDQGVISKVVNTICGIANNGPDRAGKIIIGVADKVADAQRVGVLDGVTPKKVGNKYVVGVAREAKILGITMEQYLTKWKNGIKSSDLSAKLKSDVLSNIDYNSFYGLGVIVITVPPQNEISYVGEDIYWRESDNTSFAKSGKQIADIAKRF